MHHTAPNGSVPTVSKPSVRPMRPHDAAAAAHVSGEAGARFAAITDPRIAACATDAPFTEAELLAYSDQGRAWVATDGDHVVGFLVAEPIDGGLHIEDVAVATSSGRRGHGWRLVRAAIDHADSIGARAVTLTTFRDVPWNAPWYARLGFLVVSEDALSSGLRARRDHENATGLPAELRVVMSLDRVADVLLRRGIATLVASFEAYATGSVGAHVQRSHDIVAAVFPNAPEGHVYNNALVERGLLEDARSAALDAVESAYAAAKVDRFAVWVAGDDAPMRAAVERRGYRLDTSTVAMGLYLQDAVIPHPEVKLVDLPWSEYLSTFGMPAGLLERCDHSWLRVVVAAEEDEPVSTAAAYDHAGDCGIFNVTTVEHARGRGLATATTALQLLAAIERGCTSATLQSTAAAVGVYERLGFRALGRLVEYVPGGARTTAPGRDGTAA